MTVGEVADSLAAAMGVRVALTAFIPTGQMLYLPVAWCCEDGETRPAGVYVNADAHATPPGSTGAFSNYAKR